MSAGCIHYIVGKGGGEVCLINIRCRLGMEGFPWEELGPLLTGSLPHIPGLAGLRVSRLVVDDPAQAAGQQVLSVAERGQHVEVPHPVDVQGGQEVQVSVGPSAVVSQEGNPTLLVPQILVFLLSVTLLLY